MADKRLAGEWAVAFTSNRGDLPWNSMIFGYKTFNSDACCHQCGAHKKIGDRNCRDLRPDAPWVTTMVSHEEFMRRGQILTMSTLPGWRLELNHWDSMHGLNLGVLQHTAGNVLYELCHRREATPNLDSELEKLHIQFKNWCKNKKITCSTPTFSKNSIFPGGDEKAYPELSAKAANTETVLMWLSEICTTEVASEHDAIRAMTVDALARFMHGMKACDRFLDEEEIEMLVHAGRMFNLGYQALSAEAHGLNVLRWKIVPKFHYFCHMLIEIEQGKINPRFQHCFCDEDFVGRVANICCNVHTATLDVSSLLRYLQI